MSDSSPSNVVSLPLLLLLAKETHQALCAQPDHLKQQQQGEFGT
jgi:hypothetical protein